VLLELPLLQLVTAVTVARVALRPSARISSLVVGMVAAVRLVLLALLVVLVLGIF
jgi:hypothetical protein